MARQTNNELLRMPGFFYYPADKEGLELLTMEQRTEIMANQGNYIMVGMQIPHESTPQFVDLRCNLDNGRIPTHRRPDTSIPTFGNVPFDLREVIAT
ncbi:hypothetical protein D3C81_848940 [compost metagenome]